MRKLKYQHYAPYVDRQEYLARNSWRSMKDIKKIGGIFVRDHNNISYNQQNGSEHQVQLVIHTGVVTDVVGNPVASKSFSFTTGST